MTANLRTLTKEKRESPMKRHLLPATAMAAVLILVLFAPAIAFSQTPTSGALLTIDGTAGAAVHLKLYDSQIHSGSVQIVPVDGAGGSACSSIAKDNIPTDAYVLQGGAPTGCDPNDPYEVTDNNPSTSKQVRGQADFMGISGFHIETHYLSEPIVHITDASQSGTTTTYTYDTVTRGADLAGGETIVITGMGPAAGGPPLTNNGTFLISSGGSGTFIVTNVNGFNASSQSGTGTVANGVCNTSGTICASPDSGFLTVTNNTGSDFSGTISLIGTSTGCGAASDSTSGLPAGSSVTLALGAQGTEGPNEVDSSNCGGFNQAQTLTLVPNVTQTAFFGKDDYQITTLNSASGDTVDVLPVPVPAGPLGSGTFGPFPSGCVGTGCTFQSGEFGTETPSLLSPLRFSAGTNFAPTKFACVPYSDFSADGNPVCVELQVTPTGSDPYLYTVQNDFNIDGHSLPNGIGGPAFLGHHLVNCPDSGFDQNIFLTYTAATVSFGDPLKGSSGGGGSCWVVAFDPSATAVTTSVSSFVGFQGLFPALTLNLVHPGSAEPLNFTFPTSGLHLCSTVNNSGSVCGGGAPTPWVAFGTLPINCSTGIPTQSLGKERAAGGSGLQTISSTSSFTSYRFNWKTDKAAQLGSCVVVIAQFSSGLFVFPDDFKFVK